MKHQQESEIVITPEVIPSFIPIKCPVCLGFGSFSYGKIPCKSCDGLGFLKVPPKEEDSEEARND